MLEIEQLVAQYPQYLRVFRRNILREYLQHKILEIIYSSEFSNKLVFIGGTSLRIVYENTRFSEDLDFDNTGLLEDDFSSISKLMVRDMRREGYQIRMDQVMKGAWRCNLRFPGLLFQQKMSGYTEESILIQIDTQAQSYDYVPDQKIINKFDVFSRINIAPLPLLLSQKIYAAFNRKRPKGRDFFDIIFLFSRTSPDFQYLSVKLNISSQDQLKERFSAFCNTLDFEALAVDVQPFLFKPSDSKRVESFPEYIAAL